jgi:5S rRNA maturation endonuclease (ribonuclease M5)
VRSLADALEARTALDRIPLRITKIPEGSTRLDDAAVPPEAQLWVLRAGMTPTEASTVYGFRWHEQTRRVFVPINPRAVLARAVFGERPKYKLFGELQTTAYTVQGKDPLVIVEDVLSAIKVGKAGYKAVAILGTSINSTILAPLAMRQRDIVIWLDPDSAGMAGRQAVKKALALYPAKVRYARTTDARDPKYVSREDIKSVIEETMKHDS